MASRRTIYGGLTAIALAALFALPGSAAASDDLAIQTGQVLPPGQNTCPALVVTGIQVYLQEDGVHSFDLSISDPSYVALVGTVGDQLVPFNQMTRRINPDGSLRIHADINTMGVRGSLPVTVTMLSAAGGRTCITAVAFSVHGNAGTVPTPTPAPGTTPGGAPSPAGGQGAPVTPTAPVTGGKGTTTPVGGVLAAGSLYRTLEAACGGSGDVTLWLILLALYAVWAAFAALSSHRVLETRPFLRIAAIAAPAVLLILFWLIVAVCRAGWWVPIVTLLIGAAALYAAYVQKPGLKKVIYLPAARK